MEKRKSIINVLEDTINEGYMVYGVNFRGHKYTVRTVKQKGSVYPSRFFQNKETGRRAFISEEILRYNVSLFGADIDMAAEHIFQVEKDETFGRKAGKDYTTPMYEAVKEWLDEGTFTE